MIYIYRNYDRADTVYFLVGEVGVVGREAIMAAVGLAAVADLFPQVMDLATQGDQQLLHGHQHVRHSADVLVRGACAHDRPRVSHGPADDQKCHDLAL